MKKLIAYSIFFLCSYFSLAQTIDTTQTPGFFRGQITATNNGISLIPNFSLNKPAVLFDLSVGKGRLSFDPMLRWGLNGKPWTFVFWFRYKLINHKKFNMSLGAHPSVLFRTETANIGGVNKELLTSQRYIAWEATPTYQLNRKIGVGLYYLGSRGLTKDLVQFTHFLAIRAILANLKLTKQFNFTLVPQIYYLQQDNRGGTYFNASFSLAKSHFPVSLSANISKTFKTEIIGKDFLWSIGLVYNINNRYVKMRDL